MKKKQEDGGCKAMDNQQIVECAKREMPFLRQELHDLKTCQVAFLTTAFTVTGLILGLIPKLSDSGLSSMVFLTPLVIILPAFCFFFDKARTITRIVGYYRVLERLLNSEQFPGWENALAMSRKELGSDKKLKRFIRVMLMKQPHGYWSLAFYTFTLLSLLSLAIAWKLAASGRMPFTLEIWILVLTSAVAACCLARNLYLIWHLTVGKSSYEANFGRWAKRLDLTFERS